MKSEAILELDRLEGMFIRLRNLFLLRKERTKISDREKRLKWKDTCKLLSMPLTS